MNEQVMREVALAMAVKASKDYYSAAEILADANKFYDFISGKGA